ncbi:MAG: hypothetical protein IPM74_15550 [Crocinitomicaceae bacterium]|nr:hypothetical protein [Crocinitomicaceae bacterium]
MISINNQPWGLLLVIGFILVSFFFWLDPKEAKSQGPQKRQAILLANSKCGRVISGTFVIEGTLSARSFPSLLRIRRELSPIFFDGREALSEYFTFSPDNSENQYHYNRFLGQSAKS